MQLFAAIYHTEAGYECPEIEITIGIFDSRSAADEAILKDFERCQHSDGTIYSPDPRPLEDYENREFTLNELWDN